MIHLRAVQARRLQPWPDVFPYSVPVLANLETLELTAPVTFFVGENGSGKSTLLEAIACAAALPTVGSAETGKDSTLAPLRALAKDLRLVWNKRIHKGFFMRSEDFFGFARRVEASRAEMQGYLDDVDREYKGRSQYARNLARMAYQRELSDMQNRYGDGVDARSHGESYLSLFQQRFLPGGVYLLDEPEAPLSPKRQIALLLILHEMVAQDAQFLIATHSPILMRYPGAAILRCDTGRLEPAAYESLEHVAITKDFLNNPRVYLRELGIDL